MSKTLAERFTEARSATIEWEGGFIYSMYEILPTPSDLVVYFLESINDPIQGLYLKSYGGSLEINEVVSSKIILWRDSAPACVPVRFNRSGNGKSALRVWNVWRRNDIVHSWQGNAAMRVNTSSGGSSITLSCSDGESEVDFSDLVVRVDLI